MSAQNMKHDIVLDIVESDPKSQSSSQWFSGSNKKILAALLFGFGAGAMGGMFLAESGQHRRLTGFWGAGGAGEDASWKKYAEFLDRKAAKRSAHMNWKTYGEWTGYPMKDSNETEVSTSPQTPLNQPVNEELLQDWLDKDAIERSPDGHWYRVINGPPKPTLTRKTHKPIPESPEEPEPQEVPAPAEETPQEEPVPVAPKAQTTQPEPTETVSGKDVEPKTAQKSAPTKNKESWKAKYRIQPGSDMFHAMSGMDHFGEKRRGYEQTIPRNPTPERVRYPSFHSVNRPGEPREESKKGCCGCCGN